MFCIQTSVLVAIFELIWIEKTVNIFETKLDINTNYMSEGKMRNEYPKAISHLLYWLGL